MRQYHIRNKFVHNSRHIISSQSPDPYLSSSSPSPPMNTNQKRIRNSSNFQIKSSLVNDQSSPFEESKDFMNYQSPDRFIDIQDQQQELQSSKTRKNTSKQQFTINNTQKRRQLQSSKSKLLNKLRNKNKDLLKDMNPNFLMFYQRRHSQSPLSQSGASPSNIVKSTESSKKELQTSSCEDLLKSSSLSGQENVFTCSSFGYGSKGKNTNKSSITKQSHNRKSIQGSPDYEMPIMSQNFLMERSPEPNIDLESKQKSNYKQQRSPLKEKSVQKSQQIQRSASQLQYKFIDFELLSIKNTPLIANINRNQIRYSSESAPDKVQDLRLQKQQCEFLFRKSKPNYILRKSQIRASPINSNQQQKNNQKMIVVEDLQQEKLDDKKTREAIYEMNGILDKNMIENATKRSPYLSISKSLQRKRLQVNQRELSQQQTVQSNHQPLLEVDQQNQNRIVSQNQRSENKENVTPNLRKDLSKNKLKIKLPKIKKDAIVFNKAQENQQQQQVNVQRIVHQKKEQQYQSLQQQSGEGQICNPLSQAINLIRI